MELELYHFKWCGVPVSHKISNKSSIGTGVLSGPRIIRNPSSVHNRLIKILSGHIIDQRHEAGAIDKVLVSHTNVKAVVNFKQSSTLNIFSYAHKACLPPYKWILEI